LKVIKDYIWPRLVGRVCLRTERHSKLFQGTEYRNGFELRILSDFAGDGFELQKKKKSRNRNKSNGNSRKDCECMIFKLGQIGNAMYLMSTAGLVKVSLANVCSISLKLSQTWRNFSKAN
jgi:hypothetical protein